MTTLFVSTGDKFPDCETMATLARERGWSVERLTPSLNAMRSTDEPVYYGEIDVGLAAAARYEWGLLEPTFDLLASLPGAYLSRRVRFSTLGAAKVLAEQQFVKPADCAQRHFDADVYPEGRYIRCRTKLSDDLPVLISDPVVFDVEYRQFVLGREILTWSPYVRGGWRACEADGTWKSEPQEAREALDFGNRLLGDNSLDLPPAFTLDVGRLETGGWAVVEFNPIWCSGLLGSQPDLILPALRRACVPRKSLAAEDREWHVRGEYTQERTKPPSD